MSVVSWQPPEQLLTTQQNDFFITMYTGVLQGRNRSIKASLVTDDNDGIATIVRLSSDRPSLYRHLGKSVWLCVKLK